MDLTLHAYMFMQSGIPVLYGGDEMGQVNDYTYKEDPDKRADSRYIHRGAMNWELAENISDPDTMEGKLFGRRIVKPAAALLGRNIITERASRKIRRHLRRRKNLLQNRVFMRYML